MCTSITITTDNNDVILGRTMDWKPEPYEVIFAPRNFQWTSKTSFEQFHSKFAFIGLGTNSADLDNDLLFIDGVNEMGLMCASLYLDNAYYSPFQEDKHNLESYEVVSWILSQFSSVKDVIDNIYSLNILNSIVPSLKTPLTLHWIINDKLGKSVVIEKTKFGLQLYSDSVGTLANDPIYAQHLCDLSPYLPYNSKIFENKELPGDFSSPSRFIRAALLRQSITNASNETEGILNVYKVLENVATKDEILIYDNPSFPVCYTSYTTAMCANSGNYYAMSYGNNQINKFNLFHEELSGSDLVRYKLSEEQAFENRN